MPRKAVKKLEIVVKKPKRKQVGGKGDYKSFFRKAYNVAKAVIPQGTFSKAGSMLAGPTGALAGALLSKVTGMGNYTSNINSVQHNALFKKNASGNAVQIPQFKPGKHGVQIAHCEYIGDIICGTGTPSAFTIQNFACNPGISSSFPWLSQIAQNFETYRFHGLVYEAKSLCTDNTATFAGLGSIIMAADYNSANANYINKFQMENYEGAVSAKPSQSLLFGVECNPSDVPENHLFIRSGAVPSGQDQKTYDLAEFQIATVGMPVASQQICELWVSYVCDLMQPKLYGGQLGNGINAAHYAATTGVSSSAYFGTVTNGVANAVAASGSTLALGLGAAAISFPANIVTGNYMILYSVVGGSVGSLTITGTTTTNCSVLNILTADTTNKLIYGGTSTQSYNIWYISITGPSAVFTLSAGTLPSSITSMDLIVQQLPVNITT